MKWSELKDKPVVTVAGGEQMGFVDDLFLDADGRQVLGLRTRSGGLITHHSAMLWSSINAVGQDAVTVKDASVLNDEAAFADLKDAMSGSQVVGARVLTVSGHEVGKVADLCLDAGSGAVVDYALGVGLIDRIRGTQHLIPVAGVRTVGADRVVVEESAVPQPA